MSAPLLKCALPRHNVCKLWRRNLTDTLFPKQTGPTCHVSAKCQVVSTCKTVVRNESSAAGNPQTVASTSNVLHASMKMVKCNFPLPIALNTCRWTNLNVPIQPATWNIPKKWSFFPVVLGQLSVFASKGDGYERCNTYWCQRQPLTCVTTRGIPQWKWVFN